MKKYAVTTSVQLHKFFFICGICMLISELWKQWYLTFRINGGVYRLWYVPFQLCSIAMYILLLLPWIHKTRIRTALLTFLMSYSMLGGMAVFADTSGLQYPALPLTVHSYLWHILLIIIGVSAGISTINIKFSLPKSLPWQTFSDSTLLYLGCCIVATLINRIVGKFGLINMFYINPRYKMQQIGFSALVVSLGNTTAIFSYMAGTILGAAIIFCVWKGITECIRKALQKNSDKLM